MYFSICRYSFRMYQNVKYIFFFLASESNPWNFGTYALSANKQNKVGGFSIVAQQTPCGLASTSQNADSKAG